jgi:hypothetical protein
MQPDELTSLERQLAACLPSGDGLDADEMLFAAGRVSAQRANTLWPASACGLAVLSLALGAGWRAERHERTALAARLNLQQFTSAVMSLPDLVPAPPPPGPGSYMFVRRAMERDPDGWPAHAETDPSPGQPSPNPPSIRAWPGASAELDP